MAAPDLDRWLPQPAVRIRHQREAGCEPAALWAAAQSVRLSDTRALGRLIRLRIPGLAPGISFDELFRARPFTVLQEDDCSLLSGIVGRIWTIRRDYPVLDSPAAFRTWSGRGTVRVLFANWAQPTAAGGATLVSETRVAAVDSRGWLGLAALRPLISASSGLIASEGIAAALGQIQPISLARSTACARSPTSSLE